MAYSFTLQDIDEIRKGKRLHYHVRDIGHRSLSEKGVLVYGIFNFEFKKGCITWQVQR